MSALNRFLVFVFMVFSAVTAFAGEQRVEYFAARTGKIANYDAKIHKNFKKVRLFIIANFNYRNGHPESGAYNDMKDDSAINVSTPIRPDGTFDVPALNVVFEPGSYDVGLDAISVEVALEDRRDGGYHMFFIDRTNLWDDRWGSKMEDNRLEYNKLWKPFRISKERWGQP